MKDYELKQIALSKLKGKWFSAVMVCLVAAIITESVSFTMSMKDIFNSTGTIAENTSFNFGSLISLLLGGPVSLGLAGYFLNLLRDERAGFEDLLEGFRSFGKAFLLYVLIEVKTLLWTLLLIIPGIIASFRYAMSFYVLKDNPGISATDAIEASKEMMKGNKGRLFFLYFSFLGWAILSLITFGLGFLWLTPYVKASVAAFYEDLRDNHSVRLESLDEYGGNNDSYDN